MDTIKSKPTRRSYAGRLAAACVVVAGFAIAAVSPAMADGWGRGNGHWKHGDDDDQGYYGGPRVVYVQPRPVVVRPYYYEPQPVYVAPPPPVYYAPAPVYAAPSLNVVIPLRFH
ncbi:MAG TPA: hypothetical protein VM659_22630 [Dongiaceae bacterium]|nr:hypothetical protein [Dongiaceae bacterium]